MTISATVATGGTVASGADIATDLLAAVDPILSTVAPGSTYGNSLVWGDCADVTM